MRRGPGHAWPCAVTCVRPQPGALSVHPARASCSNAERGAVSVSMCPRSRSSYMVPMAISREYTVAQIRAPHGHAAADAPRPSEAATRDPRREACGVWRAREPERSDSCVADVYWCYDTFVQSLILYSLGARILAPRHTAQSCWPRQQPHNFFAATRADESIAAPVAATASARACCCSSVAALICSPSVATLKPWSMP